VLPTDSESQSLVFGQKCKTQEALGSRTRLIPIAVPKSNPAKTAMLRVLGSGAAIGVQVEAPPRPVDRASVCVARQRGSSLDDPLGILSSAPP
jgi:hypothetical protein